MVARGGEREGGGGATGTALARDRPAHLKGRGGDPSRAPHSVQVCGKRDQHAVALQVGRAALEGQVAGADLGPAWCRGRGGGQQVSAGAWMPARRRARGHAGQMEEWGLAGRSARRGQTGAVPSGAPVPEEAAGRLGLAVAADGGAQVDQHSAGIHRRIHRRLGVRAAVDAARKAPHGHVLGLLQLPGLGGGAWSRGGRGCRRLRQLRARFGLRTGRRDRA